MPRTKQRKRRLTREELRMVQYWTELRAVIDCDGACGATLEGGGHTGDEAIEALKDYIRTEKGWRIFAEEGLLCPACQETIRLEEERAKEKQR